LEKLVGLHGKFTLASIVSMMRQSEKDTWLCVMWATTNDAIWDVMAEGFRAEL